MGEKKRRLMKPLKLDGFEGFSGKVELFVMPYVDKLEVTEQIEDAGEGGNAKAMRLILEKIESLDLVKTIEVVHDETGRVFEDLEELGACQETAPIFGRIINVYLTGEPISGNLRPLSNKPPSSEPEESE